MEQIKKFGKDSYVKINLDGIVELQKGLGMMDDHVTKVGVLGSKAARNNIVHTKDGTKRKRGQISYLTNADIGFKNEKGSLAEHIPKRSWLKMPLTVKQDELNVERFELLKDFFNKKKNVLRIYKELGVKAEEIIQRAFASKGFGQWKDNSLTTIALKGSSQPLIDSGQLRQAVSSTVISK